MEIKIIINGIERTYTGEYEALHVKDWNEIVRNILDSAESYEQGHNK